MVYRNNTGRLGQSADPMCPSCPFKGASFSTSTHHMTQYLIIKVSSEFVQLYCKRYIFNIKLPLRLIQGTPNSWVAMSAFHLTMLRTILPLLVAVSACDWSIFGLNFLGLDHSHNGVAPAGREPNGGLNTKKLVYCFVQMHKPRRNPRPLPANLLNWSWPGHFGATKKCSAEMFSTN